jgi:hypothetical protein
MMTIQHPSIIWLNDRIPVGLLRGHNAEKSARPCLPIVLDDGMVTCVMERPVYLDGCIKSVA